MPFFTPCSCTGIGGIPSGKGLLTLSGQVFGRGAYVPTTGNIYWGLGSDKILVFNPSSNSEVGQFAIPGAVATQDCCYHTQTGFLYVGDSNTVNKKLFKIHPSNYTVASTIAVPATMDNCGLMQYSPNTNEIYATAKAGTNDFFAYIASDDTITAISSGAGSVQSHAIEYISGTDEIYIPCAVGGGNNIIKIINPLSKVIATVSPAGLLSENCAYSTVNNLVYFTDYFSTGVGIRLFDPFLRTFTINIAASLDFAGGGIIANPKNGYLYAIATQTSPKIDFINPKLYTIDGSMAIGNVPSQSTIYPVYCPLNSNVYVPGGADKTLAIFG